MKKQATPLPTIRAPAGFIGTGLPVRRPYNKLAGFLLLAHTLSTLIVTYLGRFWQPLQQLFSRPGIRQAVFVALIMQGLLIFLPAVLVTLIGRLPPEDVTGRQAWPGSLFLSLAAGIPAAVVFQGLNNLLIYLLVRTGVQLPQQAATALPALTDLLTRPWPYLLLILLMVAVIPAVVEEFFFRGVLLASLQSAGAVRSAVFWQAVAFALFHANSLFLLSPFLAGLLLAHIRRHSGRLWPAMLTHLSMNVSSIALAPLLPELTQVILQDHSQQATSLLYASLIAASIAAVALIPIVVLLGSRREAEKTRAPVAKRLLLLFPGDWPFALAILVQIVALILVSRW